MTIKLRELGMVVNHKRTHRLLKRAGIKAIYPKKRTTIRNPEHKIFPYLLKRMKIRRPNRVWQVDITYIKIRGHYVYLICLIDVFSRKIMAWKLSTTLDTSSCLEVLAEALKHAKPNIINSDQGCQFTSEPWVKALKENKIRISMDGKGRWADNIYIERLWRSIKYEIIYLHSFDTVQQARDALAEYIVFYNQQRPHQSLNYHTPDYVFAKKTIPTKQELFERFASQHVKSMENSMI
jgi:putative transposase